MSYTTGTVAIGMDLHDRIKKADAIYGAPASAHEMLGVIAEEYAELIEAVRSGKSGSVEWEALDIAAAAVRLAYACHAPTTAFAERSGFLDRSETAPE